ncbi:uncharacterized protein BDV17DRAFT_279347 [Aspergillus undulatus]|uniref:uncharacterized protein n=1 Tax=Aspergillus undulatus TaxID=1810928 RepID=UPI003CCD739F
MTKSNNPTLWAETPPPNDNENGNCNPYIIPQLSGERLTIPGSKGAFRILASSKQTNGLMAVFQSGAVLSDAPGFHYHNQAHDVFLVTKGFLKLWNGGKCRVLGAGDFGYVPPGIIHNPELLGPHTETFGVVTPGDWVDFFRYISDPYRGILVPESDDRDLKALLIPKVMAAKSQFDVVFQPDYTPPPLGEWDADDEKLPEPADESKPEPYFLRANTGPRYMAGGVLSRPFITTAQSGGVMAISSIESSGEYGVGANVLARLMTFKRVDHCLAVLEGTLVVKLEREEGVIEEVVREGETVVVPSGQAFALEFRSRYVRVWSFADGDGIEALVQRVGAPFKGVVLPESVEGRGWDEETVSKVAGELYGSCHANPPLIARGLRNPLGRSDLAPRKPATGVGRRSTSVMNYIRARIVRRKVEELNAKLQAAESKLSPRDEPSHINATPSSMPLPTDRPTLTPTSTLRHPEEPEPPYGTDADGPQDEGDPVEDEITEVNHHTNGIEFHGSTSSVALLGHLQKARDQPETSTQWPTTHGRGSRRPASYSIVSTLHNASFSPSAHAHANAPQSLAAVHEHNYYFEQAHVFMSGYFENVHFIHPFINKEDFHLRAHDLWLRRTPTPDPSFIALYLAVLSFGALLRVWDEATLGGLTRFEWSRKLFGEAQMYLNYLHFPNNLDAVQCLYLMAKICQNELNPNLAYMYLGLAVRTCLAAGFNRNVRTSSDPRAEWISKTWWYGEMSFSLGRPDTLGLDDYHNRPLPARDTSQHAIIPWMVDFARITRKVSVQIYHRRLSLHEKLTVALAIEAELDAWMAGLPVWIRPDFISSSGSGGSRNGDGNGNGADREKERNDLKDPKWARRQRLVLGIRYYNVKTLLFRPFLRHATTLEARARVRTTSAPKAGFATRHPAPAGSPATSQSSAPTLNLNHETTTHLTTTIHKCLSAARNTISVIHDIYRVHTFFRCWWYNTTYVTFAVSTLLLPLSHSLPPKESITRSIEKAIEILEATDESVVTRKSAEIIRYYLREFQARREDSSAADFALQGRERERDGGRGRNGMPQGERVVEGVDLGVGVGGPAGAGTAPASGSTWLGGAGNAPYINDSRFGFESGHGHSHAGTGVPGAAVPPTVPGGEFDIPDWAYGFGFPDCSFDGIARFFDDLGGLPILDE